MSNINKLVQFITESAKPELKNGEYAVALINKKVTKKLNPRTNRIKKFKTTNWLVTKIAPEDRTLKNKPKYADGKPKVTFQSWLELDAQKKSKNGKYYGYSHRAIHGFYVGELIKPGTIGNKFEYNKEVDKKYNACQVPGAEHPAWDERRALMLTPRTLLLGLNRHSDQMFTLRYHSQFQALEVTSPYC